LFDSANGFFQTKAGPLWLAFVILTPLAEEMFVRGFFFNIIATIEIIIHFRIVPNTA